MVCLGNICRSPLAEGILRQKVREQGLDWEVDSAGTGAYHIGEAPDHRSIAIAEKHGIDISDQRARQLEAIDLVNFDLILTMDKSNYRNTLNLAPSPIQYPKIEMILNYLPKSHNREVPDPYWNDDGFAEVYDMLDAACDALVQLHQNTEFIL